MVFQSFALMPHLTVLDNTAVDVANAAGASASVRLTAAVVAPGGDVLGTSSVDVSLPAGGWARLAPPPIALSEAALWSAACTPDAPRRPLYTLVTQLIDTARGLLLDSVSTSFGIRNATFDADRGLLVNGFPVKLRGLSNRECAPVAQQLSPSARTSLTAPDLAVRADQDFAGTGTFVPPNVQAYRVQRLLDIGANAWRTAHNPVDTNLLNELDARGVLVWSESRFLRNFSDHLHDAGDHVARDRNHAAIVLWSLCNENGCGETDGWEGSTATTEMPGAMLATRYMAHMKTIDATRPITANAHYTLGSNGSIMSVVDVMALTYDSGDLIHMREGRPGVAVLNGESASCQSDQGDDDASDVIACSRDSWSTADENEWDGGAFVWSGFDYRGECGGWPNTVSPAPAAHSAA
jgi:beta-galactosidase